MTKLPTPAIPPVTNLDYLALTIQPITYFVILSSVLVHGLTIGFFSLGRRVHSRVQSISRTFTQASGNGDGEPSWLARVKRVATGEDIIVNRDEEEPSWLSRVTKVVKGEDIIINRDDDDEKQDRAEKGDRLAMFAAPTKSSASGSTTANSEDEEKKEGLTEHEGRMMIIRKRIF